MAIADYENSGVILAPLFFACDYDVPRGILIIALKDFFLNRGTVIAEIGAEVQSQIVTQIQNFYHSVVVDRNTAFHNALDSSHFLFTVGVDLRSAVGDGSTVPNLD